MVGLNRTVLQPNPLFALVRPCFSVALSDAKSAPTFTRTALRSTEISTERPRRNPNHVTAHNSRLHTQGLGAGSEKFKAEIEALTLRRASSKGVRRPRVVVGETARQTDRVLPTRRGWKLSGFPLRENDGKGLCQASSMNLTKLVARRFVSTVG